MCHRNLLIATLCIILILLSMSLLLYLTVNQGRPIDPVSQLRFLLFIGMHIYTIGIALAFVFMKHFYDMMQLFFILCFGCLFMFTTCQLFIVQQYNGKYIVDPNIHINQALELLYLKIYFLLYVDAMVGSILAGVFLAFTAVFVCIEEKSIEEVIQKCLREVKYQVEMIDMDCTICLLALREKEDLVKTTICEHIFHRECLVEWLKVSRTCPNDRKEITVAE